LPLFALLGCGEHVGFESKCRHDAHKSTKEIPRKLLQCDQRQHVVVVGILQFHQVGIVLLGDALQQIEERLVIETVGCFDVQNIMQRLDCTAAQIHDAVGVPKRRRRTRAVDAEQLTEPVDEFLLAVFA
jgi:hypothetical protein